MLEGAESNIANLLLLFSIFAGAALAWTPQLLEKLNSTQAEAKAAFSAYTRLAMSMLDNAHRPLAPSTVALAAVSNLAHVITNSDGFPVIVHVLRLRCLLMARAMPIHRLDTPKSREERRLKGCNMIEIEVQRRIWWDMAAFDCNVDDEFITPTGVEHDFPSSPPTSLSAFIYRVKLAEVCREIVDTMPSILLESQGLEYDIILALDNKLQAYLKQLPVFFRLDPTSIQQSQEICKERPNIAWQRIGIHFSLHTRLCRLHRPYHLEGSTNPKYAHSHIIYMRSAQTVLDLRRSMDDLGTQVGFKPALLDSHAARLSCGTILATDVSFNPNAPDAEARKAKVLAAHQTLKKSKEESSALMEGIQRNMQTLMSTLQKQRS
ncbi:MAG: hypothetical protein M1818_003688 [Claussenomyces sp. TS43310]|nr:MAG: hypothetical protein M1818_003688 [Claussenomyces sp. TS43310]